MDASITRAEHEESKLRLAEENKRQDRRIERMEESMKRMESFSISMENWLQTWKTC